MKTSLITTLLFTLLTFASYSEAREEIRTLPLAVDMQKTAHIAAQKKVPIVLFMTASWCHFCHRLKENIIDPLLIHTNLADYAEFREVVQDKDGWHMKDFQGHLVDMPVFAKKLKATLTPTTLFFDPQGHEISERIIGLTLEEHYPFYLQQGINEGLKKLGNPKQLDINKLQFDE